MMRPFSTTQPWLLVLLFTGSLLADKPEGIDFGKTADGKPVEIYTLKSSKGLIAKVMTRGATLVELHVPDATGETSDVVLGFDGVTGYESEDNQYFGCTTGRVCNRIAGGQFSLDGNEYSLAINNGPNHLHGGVHRSFDRVVWKARSFENDRGQGVAFSYTSPDGEEGYPGEMQVKVTYFVPKETNSLSIRYTATTDKPTPINLTNHAYFNLGGHGSASILDHELKLNAEKYTPTDDTLIPTGKIESVDGTPVDFRQLTKIGRRIEKLANTAAMGYDHNFVLNSPEQGRRMRLAAIVFDRESGRRLRILTTEPGIQFYTGNFLKGQAGKDGKTYPQRSALCLETQHFPDSVNHSNFPDTVLKPGETFTSQTILNFSVVKDSEDVPNKPIEIDVKSVKKLLGNDDVLLIDCREPDEYATAKIDGSLLLPMSQWDQVSKKLADHKTKHIIVHCHHGGRSLRITNWLRENGFPNAQNMTGGIEAWSELVDKSVPKY